ICYSSNRFASRRSVYIQPSATKQAVWSAASVLKDVNCGLAQEDSHANVPQAPIRAHSSVTHRRGDGGRVALFTSTTSRVAVVHARTDQELPVSKRADDCCDGLADRLGV